MKAEEIKYQQEQQESRINNLLKLRKSHDKTIAELAARLKEEIKNPPLASDVCCPRDHPLLINTRKMRWFCSGYDDPSLGACFDALPMLYSSNDPRNRCSTCDYDLCAKCHAMEAEKIKNPKPALLPSAGVEGERGHTVRGLAD